MKPTVLVAFDRCDQLKRALEALQDVSFCYAKSSEELRPALDTFQPEVVFSIKGPGFNAQEHRPIMDFPSVKWLQVGGSGYDHFLGWDRRRLTVTNCSGVLSSYLAETVTGAMLALNGNMLDYHQHQQKRCWSPGEFRSVAEQKILVVGLGHIGRCVAKNAKSLGMHVIGVRREQISDPSVDELMRPEDLPNRIGEADVVSVHLRLKPDTNQLFDGSMFAAMKRGAMFINTSRGKVVDEAALSAALKSGQVGKAYLDVFENEPLPIESPLWTMPNVLMTPHCSDNVVGWPLKFAEFFLANLRRWLHGEDLANQV